MSKAPNREELGAVAMQLINMEPDEMWDYPTMFLLLVDTPDDERWGVALDEKSTELIGERAHNTSPAHVIEAFAMAFQAGMPSPYLLEEGQRLLGIILRTEGWGLSSDNIDPSELEEWSNSGKRFVDHPLAVETKMYSIYCPEVGHVSVLQKRHQLPALMPEAMDGAIPKAMENYVKAYRARFPEHA